MKTRFTMLVAVLLAFIAWSASTTKLGTATGTTSQTVITGGAEKIVVQCGRTGVTKVAYRLGNSTNAPTAVVGDTWLDFSSSLEPYVLKIPRPLYDRIAFIASDGTSSFTCEVWTELP
jgi:hypothetical protein